MSYAQLRALQNGPSEAAPTVSRAVHQPPRELSKPELQRVLGVTAPPTAQLSAVETQRVMHALSYGAEPLFDFYEAQLAVQPRPPFVRGVMMHPAMAECKEARPYYAAITLRLLDQFRSGDAIDLAKMRSLSPELATIAGLLSSLCAEPPPTIPNYLFMAKTIALAAQMVPMRAIDAFVRHDSLIPKRVPALDTAMSLVPPGALSGEGLIAVQHLFPTTVALLEACVARGMRAEDIHVLGSPYASNPLVTTYCQLNGMDVRAGDDPGGTTTQYAAARSRQIGRFLSDVSKLPGPRSWVLLDDGGKLHTEAIALGFPSPRTTRAVEQTSRGLTEIAKHAPVFSTVTVANAPGKRAEGPLISVSLLEAFAREAKQRGMTTLDDAIVVSAGTVGLELAIDLRNQGKRVRVVDHDPSKRANAEALGFETAASIQAARAAKEPDLILSCTGKQALDAQSLAGFKGAVASGSSAVIEGDPLQLVASGSEAVLFNMLRPCNFHGDGYENLTPAQIGLTRALLFLAVAQPAGAPGLVALASEPQTSVVDQWKGAGGDLRVARPTAPVTRPDLRAGKAGRDEWLTFLRNHGDLVYPPIGSGGHELGIYLFRDERGDLRIIDVQAGASQRTPLKGIPTKRIYSGSPPHLRPMMIELDGDRLVVATPSARGYSFSDPVTVRKYIAGHVVAKAGQQEASLAYDAGDHLVVFPSGSWQTPRTIPKAHDAPSFFLWGDPNEIVQIAKDGSRAARLAVKASAGTRRIEEAAIASEITRVLSVLPTYPGAKQVIVAESRSGEVVLLGGRQEYREELKRLPPGSIFRDIQMIGPDDPWPAEMTTSDASRVGYVDYTLPGDAAEIESYKRTYFEIK